jgi:hypothetical protein
VRELTLVVLAFVAVLAAAAELRRFEEAVLPLLVPFRPRVEEVWLLLLRPSVGG